MQRLMNYGGWRKSSGCRRGRYVKGGLLRYFSCLRTRLKKRVKLCFSLSIASMAPLLSQGSLQVYCPQPGLGNCSFALSLFALSLFSKRATKSKSLFFRSFVRENLTEIVRNSLLFDVFVNIRVF